MATSGIRIVLAINKFFGQYWQEYLFELTRKTFFPSMLDRSSNMDNDMDLVLMTREIDKELDIEYEIYQHEKT